MKPCSVDGCERPHRVRGLCDTHYAFWKRNGYVGERRIKPLEERLWARVDKVPGQGPNGDCWQWKGYVHPTGYGQIGRDQVRGNTIQTHRAAYLVTRGEIPEGLWVLHTCDNRLCCNPDHLWVGTPKENTQDMIAKGRRRKAWDVARGEDITLAKLTEDMVRAIRAEPPMTFKELGKKYGISAGTANAVKLRRTWKHIE